MDRKLRLLTALLVSLAVLFINIPFLKADAVAAEETTYVEETSSETVPSAEASVTADIDPAMTDGYPGTTTTIGLLTMLLSATLLFLAKCMIETRNTKDIPPKDSK